MKKAGVFHFTRDVLDEVWNLYGRVWMVVYLKTKGRALPLTSSRPMASPLDDNCLQMRLRKMNVPVSHLATKCTWSELAEIIKLSIENIDLENSIVNIRPNYARRVKTGGSERILPLAG